MSVTMLIANNPTRENGSFMGDQLSYLKVAYLYLENQPDVTKVIMSMSPANEMNFLWQKFIDNYDVEIIWDDWNPGDWHSRWQAWDKWRAERSIEGRPFDYYRENYLRIHGAQRQTLICGHERGLGRRNIFEYVYYGQEHKPVSCIGSDWYNDTLCHHPQHKPTRDVYIAPHCKTQGNFVFTFDYWTEVVHKLIESNVSVTVGYDGPFCEDLNGHSLYRKHWGTHEQWFDAVCQHKVVACGNTGTGWVAAACGVPLLTMEPPNSQMPDHRYRECGLQNIIEVMSEPDIDYCVKTLIRAIKPHIVLTTGCYDIIHAGHIRHLERARALGGYLLVALNSDKSVKELKGPGRPINSQEQRKTILEALRCVDEVRIFDGPNALPLIQEIKPEILACGFGYIPETVVGRELVAEWSGKVVITSQGDASTEPSTTKIIKRIIHSKDVTEICKLATAYSVNPYEKLKLMADEFIKVIDLKGDVADLGTYKGGPALILRRLAPDKHLHLFDTWQGTPIDDPLCHHKSGEWVTSLKDCMEVVGKDNRTNYYPGVFPDWIPDYLLTDYKFSFVYVDMDTYQATKDAINFFWPRLVSGGKLVFDDYDWSACMGVKKAVDERFYTAQGEVIQEVVALRNIQSKYTCIVTKR